MGNSILEFLYRIFSVNFVFSHLDEFHFFFVFSNCTFNHLKNSMSKSISFENLKINKKKLKKNNKKISQTFLDSYKINKSNRSLLTKWLCVWRKQSNFIEKKISLYAN